MAATKAEEVRRSQAEESARVEIEADALTYAPSSPPSPIVAVEEVGKGENVFLPTPPPSLPPQCSVCYRHTTTRCARCKSIRYWRSIQALAIEIVQPHIYLIWKVM